MQRGDYQKALNLYLEAYEKEGAHDFELLQQLCLIILEHGARSHDPQKQLISIFGARLAGVSSPLDLLEEGLKSRSPEIQLTSVQTLASLQDDRCDEILLKAMSSEFLPVRLEAGYYLAERKHPKAAGQIESLMHQVPPFMRFLFPDYFALIGTKESLSILRLLMTDKEASCRVEAILSAARHNRDDLLPAIRMHASHIHVAEQEACAAALGLLSDSGSLTRLKSLSKSPLMTVKLAALRSLVEMGQLSHREEIIPLIQSGDLFAIAMAGGLKVGQDELEKFLTSKDLQLRINAALALLQARDARGYPALLEILLRDTRGLGIVPHFSPGRSLLAWKIVPSVEQQAQDFVDMAAISLAVREYILREAVELDEKTFLSLSQMIFDHRQTPLVPTLVALLENIRTPAAIHLLQLQANKAGAPLIRAYCTLALFRMKVAGGYEEGIKQWLTTHSGTDMIRFRPSLSPGSSGRLPFASPYELTAEETSRLLIEICQMLADRQNESSLLLLIEAIRDGHPDNRYALAGLLLRALQ